MHSESTNITIIKNTVYLYIRSAVMMFLSLYASRIVLATLGVSDFGIYNVIGGSVAMLSVLSATLAGATQRYITTSIATNDREKERLVFTASMITHICLALIILLIAESFGLWFINSELNIDSSRIFATNFVYQGVVLCFLMEIVMAPFKAVLISLARFRFYMNLDIIRSITYFAFIQLLNSSPVDYLISYSFIQILLCLLFSFLEVVYCIKTTKNCVFVKLKNKTIFRELFSFGGWSFLGTGSIIVYNQSSSIIINLFYGVTLNAALGVTNQVVANVNTLVNNFTKVVNPEITKYHASGEQTRSFKLVNLGAKITSMLLLIIGIPLLLNINYVLQCWLVEIPDKTAIFITLSLVASYIGGLVTPLNTLLYSIGNIKNYHIWCCFINILSVVLLYICIKHTNTPESVFLIFTIQHFIKLFILLYINHNIVAYPAFEYIKNVVIRCSLPIVIIIPIFQLKWSYAHDLTIVDFIIESAISFILALVLSLYCICESGDREKLKRIIKSKLKK